MGYSSAFLWGAARRDGEGFLVYAKSEEKSDLHDTHTHRPARERGYMTSLTAITFTRPGGPWERYGWHVACTGCAIHCRSCEAPKSEAGKATEIMR